MAPQCKECQVQALAVLVIRHGRKLGERLAAMCDAPLGDLPRASLNAMLRRLESGVVTDGQDLVTLEALHAGLSERLSCEITGTRIEPRLAGSDSDGELWSMVEVPVYSSRGEEAYSLCQQLERFVELRQQLLDRVNAQRLTSRLLR